MQVKDNPSLRTVIEKQLFMIRVLHFNWSVSPQAAAAWEDAINTTAKTAPPQKFMYAPWAIERFPFCSRVKINSLHKAKREPKYILIDVEIIPLPYISL